MADLRITELPELLPGQLSASDPLAVADQSASTTKQIKAVDLVGDSIRLLPDGSIPGSKVSGVVGAGSIGTSELADKSVTAPKLADNSTATFGTVLPAAGEYIGQLWVDQEGWVSASVWDGTTWNGISGVVNINSDTTSSNINVIATRTEEQFRIAAYHKPAAGSNLFLAGPSGSSGAISARKIEPSDLPLATATTVGAVSVPTSGGLLVDVNGAVSLSSTVTAGSSPVVTYGADGRITAGRALTGADLPAATASVIGAVKPGSGLSVSADGTLSTALTAAEMPLATGTTIGGVKPGVGLSVDAGGALGVTNSITAGTGVKVTYDAQGMITGVSGLTATDVPDLDASKITTGTFDTAQIANRSITQQKLADYAVSYIQEAQPTAAPGAHPVGALWFQESTAKLSMWNGNSFMPVGQGALSEENMRFCGLFNAATGLVTALTPYGASAGLAVGVSLPNATNQLTGVYLAIDTAGTHDTKTYDVGDWIMCLGQARGWERLDLAAGGGGGGASKLADLIDVTITTPASGDVLHFNGSVWVNGGIPDPGTY